MRMKFLLFLLLLVCVFCNSYGDDDAVQAFQKKLSNLHSMTASFRQTVFSEEQVPIQQYYGQIFLKRPDEFKWDIEKPVRQIFLVRKTTMWMYEPDLEQVLIKTIHEQDIGKTPILLLTHSEVYWGQYFDITRKSEKQFVLKPKSPNELFQKIIFAFNDDLLESIEWDSVVGQRVVIHFSKIKENQILDPSTFDLKIPPNTETIREP